MLIVVTADAQVPGSCGSGEEAAGATTGGTDAAALIMQPMPLPGQQAIDFELPAVVGDEIKNIKLSDYDGKWRILCFFQAAFTFV